MKLIVINLRENEIVGTLSSLDEAQCLIKVSVCFKNERRGIEEKKWTKKNFEIIELFELN